ncbi:GTP-binding protein A [Madurella fahalii]|uniref:GTP-binding protein A n=1 Tax=Madurella fahalii TaxID=1157608 RepID=A0ABQ0FZB9_9PEZI
MGVTGAGKSTFISLLADQHVEVGHGLQSSTVNAGYYSFKHSPTTTVVLVDTPGFDDTTRSDADILKEVAYMLADLRRNKSYRLLGIIYLHRITDPRFSGSALKNLRVLEKLCGPSSFGSVVFATTMWGNVPKQADGTFAPALLQREAELKKPEFWGRMLQEGSRMTCHTGTAESARQIVDMLVKQNSDVRLDIQREMVDESKKLDETEAGKYVQREMLEAKKRYERELLDLQESIAEATKERDEEALRALEFEKEAAETRAAEVARDSQRLNITLNQLAHEESSRFRQLPAHGPELRGIKEHHGAWGVADAGHGQRKPGLDPIELINRQHQQKMIEVEMKHEAATASMLQGFQDAMMGSERERERERQRRKTGKERRKKQERAGSGYQEFVQVITRNGQRLVETITGPSRRDSMDDLAYGPHA